MKQETRNHVIAILTAYLDGDKEETFELMELFLRSYPITVLQRELAHWIKIDKDDPEERLPLFVAIMNCYYYYKRIKGV